MRLEVKNNRNILSFALLFLLLFIFNLLFLAPNVFASEFSFESANSKIHLGDRFEVKFWLNTEDQKINAMEGIIIFSPDILKLEEVRDGASITNFWAKRPSVSEGASGNLEFAGIIPGGFNGNNNKWLVFSLVFKAVKEASSTIVLTGAKSLLNDGQGTEDKVSVVNFDFVVSEKTVPAQPLPTAEDKDLPESFVIEVSQDKNFLDGKWFIVFATQDKKSGINHYEVAESKVDIGSDYEKLNWQSATSPHVLQDQKLHSFIYVKAVDNKNNERVSVLSPRATVLWYEKSWIWGIIISVITFLGGLLWRIKTIF